VRAAARHAFAVLLVAFAARAESPRVHRCVGVHGEVVFTHLPCGSHELAGISAGTQAGAAAGAPPPAESCPATETELRERVAAAVARRDANAIAGLMHWGGVGGRTAAGRLRELRELVRRPLLDLDGADGLRVRTGSNTDGGVREHAFGTAFEGGCWWLTW